MLTIRLQRVGKNKFATYRLIISEKARDTKGMYLEQLGIFNPHDTKEPLRLNTERISYWLDKGAQTSDTIHNMFVEKGLIKAKKKKSVYLTTKRKAKVADKKKAA